MHLGHMPWALIRRRRRRTLQPNLQSQSRFPPPNTQYKLNIAECRDMQRAMPRNASVYADAIFAHGHASSLQVHDDAQLTHPVLLWVSTLKKLRTAAVHTR